GKHTLKYGVDFRHVLYYTPEYLPLTTLGGAGGGSDDFGFFNFGGNFSGNAFADFLLGLPTFTYQTMSGPDAQGTQNQWAFYAQDEWRVTSKLTLNFGLRYAILPPFIEKGKNQAVFDPATGGLIVPDGAPTNPNLLASINTCGTGPHGGGLDPDLKCVPLLTASQAGLGQGLRHTYYGDYQPRVSFAFRPFGNDKTVIRGGFGIYTVINLGQFSVNSSNDNIAIVRIYTNANPVTGAPTFQFPNALVQAPPQAFIGSTNIDMNVPTNFRDPQSNQWNLTLERELPLGMALRASYLGMNTYRMQVTEDLNQVQPSTHPYNPALKPYPNWGIIYSSENAGFANYQAMQVELDKRLKNGLTLQASYMLEKNLSDYQGDAPSGFPPEILYGETVDDRFSLRNERGNVEADPRQRFLLSGTYELPIGTGKRFFANAGRAVEAILGGWQVSTIALIESGPFLTPTYDVSLVDPANLNAFNRGAVGRPDRIGSGSVSNPTPNHYFNINAFTAPPINAGRIGNSGVGVLTGPGTIAISGGLAKNFSLSERFKLRLEATVNNLPNHPNFAPPATDVAIPATFGTTSSVQTAENAANRTGQLALRLTF
ncbi:MAG TPA: TonB-dependent receptor, partial [Blastocatellia bacterium]